MGSLRIGVGEGDMGIAGDVAASFFFVRQAARPVQVTVNPVS